MLQKHAHESVVANRPTQNQIYLRTIQPCGPETFFFEINVLKPRISRPVIAKEHLLATLHWGQFVQPSKLS